MSELKEVFTNIYNQNLWMSRESKSGAGSELLNTQTIRTEIPKLIEKFNIKKVLDIPCGDYNWMSNVDLHGVDYIGADIVEGLIEENKKKFEGTKFEVLDITKDKLPKVDLIFARDVLGHFDYFNIHKALSNMVDSGSKYLLTTSFTKWHFNTNIDNGGWRPINLMIEPFKLRPLYLINENCTEGGKSYNDKCLILFDLEDLYCGN
jgi:2-polyprenyl-3-methyl-5-hydroxy-6-metoxy-1,4-benzoquinol methylase